jgi:hypothetical protein
MREGGFDGGGRVMGGRLGSDESDAAHQVILGGAQDLVEVGEADDSEGFERVGHEAFTAGLVDGGLHRIEDFHVKAVTCSSDGACQTGGARTDYQDFALDRARIHSVACTMTRFF